MRSVLLLSLILISCTSTKHHVKTPTGPMNAVFSYSASKDTACNLEIKNLDNQEKHILRLNPNKQILLVPLTDGNYRFNRLVCKNNRQWEFEDSLLPFSIDDSLTNYLGHIDFVITKDKKLGFKYNTNEAIKALSRLFVLHPSLKNKNFVSAYTKKRIFQEMLKLKPTGISYEYRDKSKNTPLKKLKFPDFDSCFDNEYKSNPLTLGDLKVEVIYKGNEQQNMNVTGTKNLYSQDFLECIVRKIQHFKPDFKQWVLYKISI